MTLYWLPLGAGGARVVRWSGACYETMSARREHRAPRDLYHCALAVGEYVIEMAPVWSLREPNRGVVAEGPVGLRWLGRSALFRYEVRRWRHGRIPDAAFAVGGPVPLSTDPELAARLLALVPSFPTATWGRDELGTGDMWNSNSLISWLLTRAGYPAGDVPLPVGGRAPGWSAGRVVALTGGSRGPVRPGSEHDN
ncbi:hypothetical protein [Actinoplanes palleronii]|uniref:Uncharacterized protein n=1 Tax=Actinoplanes palleronii TaxID=113570 RepID=A0ABQ4BN28_9ACTN|nr:hypothetical protein [Actinoplanes palleronii]GIE72095.1 hypothetical protein Apa02nite_082030 [Actinoplanes palleronii]